MKSTHTWGNNSLVIYHELVNDETTRVTKIENESSVSIEFSFLGSSMGFKAVDVQPYSTKECDIICSTIYAKSEDRKFSKTLWTPRSSEKWWYDYQKKKIMKKAVVDSTYALIKENEKKKRKEKMQDSIHYVKEFHKILFYKQAINDSVINISKITNNSNITAKVRLWISKKEFHDIGLSAGESHSCDINCSAIVVYTKDMQYRCVYWKPLYTRKLWAKVLKEREDNKDSLNVQTVKKDSGVVDNSKNLERKKRNKTSKKKVKNQPYIPI